MPSAGREVFMKRLTKASKIGLAALLIAITFFALTIFFALYQPEVDSAVNTLENAILKEDSPVENELVAEAAGTASGTLKKQILQPGSSSYTISLNASYNGQAYGYLARIWETDTDHTTYDCIYNDTTWDFGNSDRHQYDDCASVALHIDLGPYAAYLASKKLATLTFSGYGTKGGSLDNFAFSIQSSSSSFNLSPTGRTLHEAARDGGSGFIVSGEKTSATNYNANGKLTGRYLRIIFSAYDDDGFWGGPFDWINISNMSLKLTVSDSTAPTLGSLTQSSGTIGVSDSGTGVWKYTISGTRLDGTSKSGTFYFVNSGQTAASGTIKDRKSVV